MSIRTCIAGFLIVLLACVATHAESSLFKKFKSDYATLDQDLLNNLAEVGTVKDFVYKKDVATFTFTEGTLFLLRYVDERPTTAFYIGKGHAKIDIPSHVERQALKYASGDTTVDQDFEFIFIRMADNLDLKLKEKFTFARRVLDWKEFNKAKQEQGEMHFKPVIQHDYDNYFELLRSHYERSDDGYFWVDFGRYEYSFDPNRPEQVLIGYERQGGDMANTKGAAMQRQGRGIYDDARMSDIVYPTTLISRGGTFELTGMEGKTAKGMASVKILVNADSLKFLSLFLHYNLNVDSVTVGGAPADFKRRNDFNFFGVVLPRVFHKGDTIDAQLWYGGKNFVDLMPWVEDPTVSPYRVSFTAPKGFVYCMPGMRETTSAGGKQSFVIEPDLPCREVRVEAYAADMKKVDKTTELGLPLTFLRSPVITKGKVNDYVPENIYDSVTQAAIDFFGARLGNPPGVFDFTVIPTQFAEAALSMPGLLEITQVHPMVLGTGGFQLVAAHEVARQWFGELMRPKSDRDLWLEAALPEYLGLMYVSQSLGDGPFYTELTQRHNLMDSVLARGMDRPLAISAVRLEDSLLAYKGAWVLHMLRFIMLDLDKAADQDARFRKFLVELVVTVNNQPYSTADVQRIAEKYYGQPLDWFFNYWVYGRNYPEFQVTYTIAPKDNEFVINATTTTKNVDANFQMPVIINVQYEKGDPTFARQIIKGTSDSFQLGPFASKPKSIQFNEFFSVLSKDKVDKGK